MKVWITKYALSTGIFEAEAEVCENIHKDMISIKRPGEVTQYFHGKGRDWHTTCEDALTRAQEMKRAKIISLEKQIAKLRKKEF